MVVKDEIQFNTFEEFYLKAKNIKKEFEKMTLKEKCIYKMYVYSNCLLKMYIQDKIWEYLNEPIGSVYYTSYEMLGDEIIEHKRRNKK